MHRQSGKQKGNPACNNWKFHKTVILFLGTTRLIFTNYLNYTTKLLQFRKMRRRWSPCWKSLRSSKNQREKYLPFAVTRGPFQRAGENQRRSIRNPYPSRVPEITAEETREQDSERGIGKSRVCQSHVTRQQYPLLPKWIVIPCGIWTCISDTITRYRDDIDYHGSNAGPMTSDNRAPSQWYLSVTLPGLPCASDE